MTEVTWHFILPYIELTAYTTQRLFRKPNKRYAGATDYALSYPEASDTPYLSMPHVPFPLDYHQTLLSLLDVLSEVYNKISKILGPSPFPNAGQHMMGPLGLLSPHPGVSYLFTGIDAATTHEGESSLWGIAHAAGSGTPAALGGGNVMYGGALGSPPPSWNSALGDTVKQIDNKLKKLIAMLLKELDDFARAGIKDELASLDPLLRNVSVPEDPREQYEIELTHGVPGASLCDTPRNRHHGAGFSLPTRPLNLLAEGF
ncbi:hypothetical protein POSPLADRAFT_1135440 [Postia placenta MAD-698-R-SB12]|uniref:Uncharacterized protein n=1 Tax=Postia placenta MAD-698-R-SB12 TaxID=670580 RepID=A0A1X6N886_9APHY|nr:hypothetical protein POSPLADRAFT_1135440 [Postia placenta MAD-698-R-SB12]OSX64845.1 hypothetical protein POSPLADRAFT_1135440 [Postia placenta MAD-698-R-SB12]